MVKHRLDTVHVVLEDVYGDDVRLRLDGGEELLEPRFGLLHGHAGRDELGTRGFVRREVGLPPVDGVRDGHGARRAASGEIWLIEAHDERSDPGLTLLKALKRATSSSWLTWPRPRAWVQRGPCRCWVVRVGSPVVVPSERSSKPFERVAASDTCFAKRRGESRDRDGAVGGRGGARSGARSRAR